MLLGGRIAESIIFNSVTTGMFAAILIALSALTLLARRQAQMFFAGDEA